MKFLHSSDWHIGRQFHNVSLLDDQRHVLEQITELAVKHQVDAVVVAGDIYDRAVPPATAVELLDQVLHRLCHELKIPVIMIVGNHDSAERLRFGARHMQESGLHILGSLAGIEKPVVLEDEHGSIAFYGIPYVEPALVREAFDCDVRSHDAALATMTKKITADNGQKRRSVVLSHCFIAGGTVSESERPLSVGGADQVSAAHFLPFSYTALGHLHGPQYKHAEHIRYSGSILKYSFSEEQHQKSVVLVDMGASGSCDITLLPLTPKRDMRSIRGALTDIIGAAADDPNPDDYLLVQLTDSHAILDPIGKLRAHYPNVLHLERPGLISGNSSHTASREQLNKGELSLFENFYAEVKGETLSDEQSQLLTTLIDELRQSTEATSGSNAK